MKASLSEVGFQVLPIKIEPVITITEMCVMLCSFQNPLGNSVFYTFSTCLKLKCVAKSADLQILSKNTQYNT